LSSALTTGAQTPSPPSAAASDKTTILGSCVKKSASMCKEYYGVLPSFVDDT
jgi:hypothetical protein